MRKRTWLSALLVVSLAVGSVMPVGAAETSVTANVEIQMEEGGEIVEIPDENLKNYLISEGYDSNGDEELSRAEMKLVNWLDAQEYRFSDLTGLEYAINLKYISVGAGTISDMTPLARLPQLATINLANNRISDISMFGNMTKVREINLNGNPITNILSLRSVLDLGRVTNVFLQNNENITTKVLFEQLFPEEQNVTILLENKQYLDSKLNKIDRIKIDEKFNRESITWENSNPEIVEIVGSQPYIIGKSAGTATITATYEGIEKIYYVEVVNPISKTNGSTENMSTITEIEGYCAGVLDSSNTLWSVNSNELAEEVMSNTKQYIGEVVYGKNGNGYWADYFVLDNDNTLWKSTKVSEDAEYISEIMYTNVDKFDSNTVLTNDGLLYSLQNGDCIAENVKQYTLERDYRTGQYMIGDIVVTKDDIVKSVAQNKTLDEDVTQLYFVGDSAYYDCFLYLKNNIVYIWGQSKGTYIQVERIHNVDYISQNSTGTFLTFFDGSTSILNVEKEYNSETYETTYAVDVNTISDYPIIKIDKGGFIDAQNNYWSFRYDENNERYYYLAGTNVEEIYSYSYYLSKDNKVYERNLSTYQWNCILENVKDFATKYYIGTDDCLYEKIGTSYTDVQKILTDVVAVKRVSAGFAFALRKDGSIWKCESVQSLNGVPYCIMPANIEYVNSFVDVQESDWYYNAVSYVHRNGIMAGMTEDSFGADELLARVQFATMLYRLEGTPETAYEGKFSDVPNSQWYTNAVIWASNNNIVSGYKNTTLFGSADNITREQIAVMMYRYAKYKGYDISEKASLDRFMDAGSVSDYAVEAMQWAVGNGIINGTGDGKLNPLGTAYRAECAVIFKGFMEKYGK